MTKTVLVATSLTAIFVASMIMVPAFAGGHLIFEEVEVEKRSLEIEVSADIPQDGSAGPFGYGAFGTKAIFLQSHLMVELDLIVKARQVPLIQFFIPTQ